MMTSSSISAYDLLSDHPFPGIQLVTPTDHHDHGGHYCHNWVSHHHHQLDQHDQEQVGSEDKLSKQDMDVEKGIEAWDWEQKDDLYDPMIGSADIDSDDIHDNWVPNSSKLRVVKKMNPKRASKAGSVPSVEISTDDFHYFQPENDSSSNNSGGNGNNNNGIRVCSDCNTTKTPLWRSGPKGPKSLCNACGIRQRKARKALAAASAAAAGSDNNASVTKATVSPKSLKAKTSNSKEKKTNITYQDDKQGWQQPYKKRLKHAGYTSASQDSNPSSGKDADDHQYSAGERHNTKQICFEEFITASLNKNASLHRVFPQDEKEAAILLMALSCGLVHN